MLKWNNQLGSLSRRARAPQAEPGGICPGWLCSPRMHTLSTPHARQSKARLRGPLWVNSLAGPRRTETCLLFAATHSRFSSPLTELRSRTPHQVIREDRAQFIPVLSLLFIIRAKNRFFFSSSNLLDVQKRSPLPIIHFFTTEWPQMTVFQLAGCSLMAVWMFMLCWHWWFNFLVFLL